MTHYLDASFCVALLTPEGGTARVSSWLEAHRDEPLAISLWVHVQVASAFSMKMRIGSLNEEERAAALTGWMSMRQACRTFGIPAGNFTAAAQMVERAHLKPARRRRTAPCHRGGARLHFGHARQTDGEGRSGAWCSGGSDLSPAVAPREEIVECYAMSGEWDYLLRIAVRDVDDYDRFICQGVLAHPSVANAASNFALRQVKYTTEIPV